MDVSGLDKRDVPEPGPNMCQCLRHGHGWTGLAQIRIQTLTQVNVNILYCTYQSMLLFYIVCNIANIIYH